MSITPSFNFYVENVIQHGADPSGSVDSSTAFQAAINTAISNGYNRIYIPLALGQKYLLKQTISINSSDFYIYGDAPYKCDFQNAPFGYLFTDSSSGITSIFNLENSTLKQFYIEGVNFFSDDNYSLNNTSFFYLGSNIQLAGFTAKKISINALNNFLYIADSYANNIHIEDCQFTLNSSLISLVSKNTNLQIEHSEINILTGSILICSGEIEGNVLFNENIVRSKPEVQIFTGENNSLFNFNTNNFNGFNYNTIHGSFVFNVQSKNQFNTCKLSNQVNLNPDNLTDIFLFEGYNELFIPDNFQVINYINNNNSYERINPLTLNPDNNLFFDETIGKFTPKLSVLTPGTDINSEGFYSIPNNVLDSDVSYFSSAYLKYENYVFDVPYPNNGRTQIALGGDFLNTPFGDNPNGYIVNFGNTHPLTVDNMMFDNSNSIVFCALLKHCNIQSNEIITPKFLFYDPASVLFQKTGFVKIHYSQNEKWYVYCCVIEDLYATGMYDHIDVVIDFESNLGASTIAQIEIAGIGSYIIPDDDITFFSLTPGLNKRVFVRPFTPYL